jgi:hypothetical protein
VAAAAAAVAAEAATTTRTTTKTTTTTTTKTNGATTIEGSRRMAVSGCAGGLQCTCTIIRAEGREELDRRDDKSDDHVDRTAPPSAARIQP